MNIHRILLISCLAALLVLGVVPTAFGVCGGGTIDVRVSTGDDDAEECLDGTCTVGAVYLTSTDLELIHDAGSLDSNQEVGMRFQNISIPQGATITNAYVEFTTDFTPTDTTNLTFYAEDIDDAPTFTTATNNITNRTKTLASVDWDNVPVWDTVGETHQTPDLSLVIKEIVDRTGWTSGNDLVIIVTGSGRREAESWNGANVHGDLTLAPLLHVEYTEPGGGPGTPLVPCDWGARRKLTFDNSAQTENLVNFPVLVVLNSSRIDYGKTQDAGEDLRFADADGTTELAYEIETWNESGTSYVWVKVPQIDASSNTDHIWMYYDNTSATDNQDPQAVWSNGYAGVWHLKETPTVDSNALDSTCTGNNGNFAGSMTSVDQVAGQIDGSLDFDGSDDYIDAGSGASLDITSAITVEAWVKIDTDTLGRVVTKHNGPSGNYGWAIMRAPASDSVEWRISTTGSNWIGGNTAANGWPIGVWRHIVTTYDGANMRAYIGGAAAGGVFPVALTGSINVSTGSTEIGRREGENTAGRIFNGILDEVRISNIARSAAWIAAQHKSMTDAFIITPWGAEQAVPALVNYFSPDAAAAGMHVPVTFVGAICTVPTVTTSSSDIVVGPSILTDETGAVVTQDGDALSTMFFVKPSARPATGITVSLDGDPLTQTFDLVVPSPDPNVTSGTVSLSGGTSVLGGLTVGAGGTLQYSTATDLPPVILVKGDVNIAGTLDVSGQNGTDGGADSTGGNGGGGGPGGGGGGGGGVKEGTGGGSGTVDVRVSTGDDDAEECLDGTCTVGAVGLNSSDLELIYDDGSNRNQEVGMRFLNITVPQGATITNAYIEFETDRTSSVTTNLTFWGEAIDNAPTFLAQTNNITNRAKTGNSVAWSNVPAWNTVSEKHQTPDLSPIIQEIVNRSGWSSGNALVVIVTGTSGSWREAESYNGEPANAPLLHAEWTEPGGSATAAPGGAGFSGGGGGGNKGSGTGGAGGDGTGAAGSATSGTTGGDGGTALGGASGGGGGAADAVDDGGSGGGGGTGNPAGSGGLGDGGAGGKGGGGGGTMSASPGGGGGGGFATAGQNAADGDDFGQGGLVNGNAALVPLSGGSGGGGGAPDQDGPDGHRGGGGGGGGGAILLYATGSISLTGTLTATGGNGGAGTNGSGGGGGGSGGAILLQSGDVTASGTLTTASGTGGTSTGSAAGGAGGSGRIRIDGLVSGSVPGTAGSKFIGPVIDTLVGTTVTGRGDGAITLYVYDETGAQVTGSPYTTSTSGSSGNVQTWSISGVTFPSGVGYLAVKQSVSGSDEVFGPGRATKGVHLINWREGY